MDAPILNGRYKQRIIRKKEKLVHEFAEHWIDEMFANPEIMNEPDSGRSKVFESWVLHKIAGIHVAIDILADQIEKATPGE